ncbi:MAG TPA: hypothetical protein VFM88_01080 [Vicinamibacteria bacterium]|nr:hypothetical protein [Vicinamibacteria bacterium]
MRRRRLPTPPQERKLIPDAMQEQRRALERQFREFVEMNDEAGYWAWLSLQPGFDPESPIARKRAVEAWREARAAWLRERPRP